MFVAIEKLLKCKRLIKFLKEAPENMRGFLIDKDYIVCTNAHFLYFEHLSNPIDSQTFIDLDGKEYIEGVQKFPDWKCVIPKNEKFKIFANKWRIRKLKDFLKNFQNARWVKFEKQFEEDGSAIMVLSEIKIEDFELVLKKPLMIGYISYITHINKEEKIEIYFAPHYLTLMLMLLEDLEEIVFYQNAYPVLFKSHYANFLLMPIIH